MRGKESAKSDLLAGTLILVSCSLLFGGVWVTSAADNILGTLLYVLSVSGFLGGLVVIFVDLLRRRRAKVAR